VILKRFIACSIVVLLAFSQSAGGRQIRGAHIYGICAVVTQVEDFTAICQSRKKVTLVTKHTCHHSTAF